MITYYRLYYNNIISHIYDVCMSMHKRETEMFKMGKAMRLWYIYNKRAIQQSHDLCRVRTLRLTLSIARFHDVG